MPRKPTTRCRFYVYDLIDPRTDEIFYVGCGTGDRHLASARDAPPKDRRRHRWTLKQRILEELRDVGLEPISKIIFAFKSRGEALYFEKQRHEQLGLPYGGHVGFRAESGWLPLETWCGHPGYERACRFLPYYCNPQWRDDEPRRRRYGT